MGNHNIYKQKANKTKKFKQSNVKQKVTKLQLSLLPDGYLAVHGSLCSAVNAHSETPLEKTNLSFARGVSCR